MSAFEELYSQILLDHSKNPRNAKELAHPSCSATGHNPLCGDSLKLSLIVDNGIIQDIGLHASGCAISRASASIMGSLVKGKTPAEAKNIFEQFHTMLTTDSGEKLPDEELEELQAFSGVRAYPMRVKCATLAWHALQHALEGKRTPVLTED